MSKHWRPEDFGGPGGNSGPWLVTLVLAAIFAGLVGGVVWQRWPTGSADAAPDSPIEWNAVQAVPTRAPDAEDVAWATKAVDPSLVIPSPAAEQGQAIQSGLPRTSSARNDKIYVIDGDTFSMGGQRIRVANIDAPETHPPRCMEEARLGLAATQKLRELLGSGTVTTSGIGHDQYGRELRSVQVNGQDVGETMISAGVAREYGRGRRPWC